MLVKIGQGQSYASVLGKLRKNVNPDTSNTRVLCSEQTKDGGILLQLDERSNKEAFSEEVAKAVQGIGNLKITADKKVTLENRDIDFLAEEKEVHEVLTVLQKKR